MDIFDRIAAALGALQAGNDTALAQHVAAIDSHLSDVDSEVLGLQSDDTSGKARLDAIETGLAKIADTLNPPVTTSGSGDTSGTAANPGGGSDTGAVSGTGADAGNPGGTSDPTAQTGTGADAGNPGGDGSAPAATGDGSAGSTAPIPTSGVGSETTGQVDTPDTQP